MMSYITDKVVCKFVINNHLYTTIGGADVHPRHDIKHDQMVRKNRANQITTKNILIFYQRNGNIENGGNGIYN